MRAALQRLIRWARSLVALAPAVETGATLAILSALAFLTASYLPGWLAPARPDGGWLAASVLALLLLAFALATAAVARLNRPRALASSVGARIARWVTLALLLWALLSSIQTLTRLSGYAEASLTQFPPRYTSDEMYYNQYGALLALRGENPYTDANVRLARAMVYFHIRGFTPIARGRFAGLRNEPTATPMRTPVDRYLAHPADPPPEIAPGTLHSYPAGAFLVDVPFIWAGLPGMGAPQIALYLALVAALVVMAPPGARLPILLLALCNPDLADSLARSDFDIWWIAALIGAWALERRAWTSSILLGVACAIKQTAWFFAPFYALWVWRERGPREALRRCAVALGGFSLINAPWIIASPVEWARGLLLPLTLPLFPQGSGLVALMLNGALPWLPSLVFSLLEVAVWLGAMALCWRLMERAPYAGLVLPLLPLLLAWRSPGRYFTPLTLLTAAALALTLRRAARVPHNAPASAPAVSLPA